MNDELELKDIADDLVILNKYTVDTLYSLENGADCIALYIFFYKTAKWQKTNSIKANEDYIKKCLGWGYDKIRRAKNILKENGLIQMVQNRKDNKIEGWYIQISYLVSQNSTDKIKVINNTQKQEVGNPTSREQEINALKYNINILENNNKMLEEENIKLKKEIEILKENNINIKKNKKENNFDEIFDYWNTKKLTVHKESNDLMKQAYEKALKNFNDEQIKNAIDHYDIMFKDKNCWFDNKYSLTTFLSQKNLIVNFVDDGSWWQSYVYKMNKPIIVKQGLATTEIIRPKRDDNDII